MNSPRPPNPAMRILLVEARWSGARLAREVNALAAEQGLTLRYDRTAVSHWLTGTRPHPPTSDLVAEALSRHLGRKVAVADTGLTVAHHAHGTKPPRGGEDAISELQRLGAVTGRRRAARTGVFSLAALMLPGWDAPTGLPVPAPAGRSSTGRTAPPDVTAAALLLNLFSRHDMAFGAGRVRDPLRAYLATTVSVWLRQSAPPKVRGELCAVAGQLAYLCAFAHFDGNLQERAQRYYLTGISLAREAGDRVGFALGARGLSIQALSLGHPQEADRLAGLAVRVGLPHAPAHQQAFLLGQLAITQAHLGEHRAAARHLIDAEKRLERSDSAPTPVGAFHSASLSLQHAAVARAQQDHAVEARHLVASLRRRPQGEDRARSLSLATLAEAQLNEGHLDLACQSWGSFLGLYPDVNSARVHDRLQVLLSRLRPYAAHAAVPPLLEQARALSRRRIAR